MATTLEGITEPDLRRFAACWLKSDGNTDWDAATKLWDPEEKVQVASFKTVTKRAVQKLGVAKGAPAAPKRKKGDSEEGGEKEKPKAKKAKAAPKAKKGGKKAEEKVAEDDEEPVKPEETAEEDEA